MFKTKRQARVSERAQWSERCEVRALSIIASCIQGFSVGGM